MALDKCPRCGFDDVIEKNVDKVLTGGSDAAVITVPAEVCLHCGERFYKGEVGFCFDAIRKRLDSGQVDEFQPMGRYFRVPASFLDTGAEDMAKFLAELSVSDTPQAD